MSYCEGKPSAKVLIQFKNGAKEEVVTDNVPVDVSVTKKRGIQPENPDSDSGNCCNVTYLLTIKYTACEPENEDTDSCKPGTQASLTAEAHVDGKLMGVKTTKRNSVTSGIAALRKNCEGKEEESQLIGLSTGKLVSYSISEIKRADGKPDICDPPDDDDKKCSISVKDKNGQIIYKKDDDCPIKFKVRCGNQCAEGEIRCQSNSYPG